MNSWYFGCEDCKHHSVRIDDEPCCNCTDIKDAKNNRFIKMSALEKATKLAKSENNLKKLEEMQHERLDREAKSNKTIPASTKRAGGRSDTKN